MAEGILKSKVSENVYVDSAGTAAYHVGELPDKRSISVAKKYGIDLTNQRARRFTVKDFEAFDLIYAMDQSNYQNILSLSRNNEDEQKVQLILNKIDANSNQDVPDPYYGGNDGFENVYQMLDEACEIIASKIE